MFAERVLKTTKLFTSTGDWPYAGGVAMAGDRICAVGPWDEVELWVGPDTEVLDLGDAFVCPDFTTVTCISTPLPLIAQGLWRFARGRVPRTALIRYV